MTSWPDAVPPAAPQRPATRRVHGTELVDEFAWLRAENWREVLRDPSALPEEIRRHLEAENAYSAALLAPVEALRRQIVAELRGRMEERDQAAPQVFGAYLYQARFGEGADHPTIVRRLRAGGPEEVVLDASALAQGSRFFELGGWRPSPDHRILAYAVDRAASELFTVRLRDLPSGLDRPDLIADTSGRVVWNRGGSSLLYVRVGADHRPSRVYRHRLWPPGREDELIYEERDPAWLVSLSETQSGAFAVIGSRRSEESELRLVDLSDDDATARLVEPRAPGLRYEIDHGGGPDLVIRTNADGAEDYKLVSARLDAPGRAGWRDLVPARAGVTVVSHRAYPEHVAALEREDATPRLALRPASGPEATVAFEDEVLALTLEGGSAAEEGVARFTVSTPVRPPETYDLDLATGERRLVRRQTLREPINPGLYVTRRLRARAPDGEEVPVSVVHRRDLALDGSAPCLLYAYGSYGYALPPSFSAERLPLIDRGFVFAIAHIRGGADKGQRWYKDGKFAKKTNSFTDFIAAAEHLVAQGYTARGRIVAHGRSAGGMLMGAVANMAPELFAGIVADVPFVDVLNTILDPELPLTPTEWEEWGDPVRDARAFAWIRDYSPYDQVKAQGYPPILATGGLADPRVTYWEPAKWVARLRARGSGGPFLLRLNMDAGHSGTEGRFRRLDEQALTSAFALHCVGLA